MVLYSCSLLRSKAQCIVLQTANASWLCRTHITPGWQIGSLGIVCCKARFFWLLVMTDEQWASGTKDHPLRGLQRSLQVNAIDPAGCAARSKYLFTKSHDLYHIWTVCFWEWRAESLISALLAIFPIEFLHNAQWWWYAKGMTKIAKCAWALDQSVALWGSESVIWG